MSLFVIVHVPSLPSLALHSSSCCVEEAAAAAAKSSAEEEMQPLRDEEYQLKMIVVDNPRKRNQQ
jgi:hypothetical protein